MPRAWLSLLWAGPACALGSAAGHLRGWGHRPWNRRPSRSPRPRPASPAAIFPRLLLRLQCPEKAARLSLSGASERLLPATLSVWAQKTHHSRAQGWVFLTSTARSGAACPGPHVTPIRSPTTPHPTEEALLAAGSRTGPAPWEARGPGGWLWPLAAWRDLRKGAFCTRGLGQRGLSAPHLPPRGLSVRASCTCHFLSRV